MSNVIAFLEKMGNNAALAKLSPADYATAVEALELDAAPRQALLDRDADALSSLMGGRLKMMCFLLPADGEQKQNDDEPVEGDTPTEETPKESIHRAGMH